MTTITSQTVADKVAAYLYHEITLAELVARAEEAERKSWSKTHIVRISERHGTRGTLLVGFSESKWTR